MKLVSTIALGFAAAMLWNCNDSTQPETRAVDKRVPAMVSSVANYAAYSAGLKSIEVTATGPTTGPTEEENPFSPEGLSALDGVGLCPNFFLIVQELVQALENANPGNAQSLDPIASSPTLAKAFQCIGSKAQAFQSVEPSPAEALGVIDECLCGGSGNLFGTFLFAVYGAPGVPGGGYTAPKVPGQAYAPPSIPGYNAPATVGKGYSPPSL